MKQEDFIEVATSSADLHPQAESLTKTGLDLLYSQDDIATNRFTEARERTVNL